MKDVRVVIDFLQDAKQDKDGMITITDKARCAMVRILMRNAEVLERYEQEEKHRSCMEELVGHILPPDDVISLIEERFQRKGWEYGEQSH